jgi:hypothetical protein
LSSAASQGVVGFAGLGMSPLGGESGRADAGPAVAQPIQVALDLPSTPVLERLVSLVTLTQIMPFDREGQGDEVAPPLEQALDQIHEGLDPDSAGPLAVAGDLPDALNPDVNPVAEAEHAGSPVPHRLAAPVGPRPRDFRPTSTGANRFDVLAAGTFPASGITFDLDGSPAPLPEAAAASEPSRAAVTWATRVAITGVMIVIAIRARQTIRDLKWRKGARAEGDQAPTAGPILQHRHHHAGSATWPARVPGRGSSPGSRRVLQVAGSSHS